VQLGSASLPLFLKEGRGHRFNPCSARGNAFGVPFELARSARFTNVPLVMFKLALAFSLV